MIRHIVGWNFKEECSEKEKKLHAQRIKEELENLSSLIPEIISIEVVTNLLDSSTHDIMLNSLFASEDDLKIYQIHPEHLRVGKFIASVVKDRACFDFIEIGSR